ncbi:hypothetical protein [Lyngbya sp. CCY1209]|uniref:hypothetical protein n=1 Tax=Lyngbya sp. CCY1209 TaxID=2886103 RepID=UPI002D20880A|nr:hypothetical protein [Lyngbya sp. CCY1209]MEB3881883.1 hypothetical protein [Lyngbya sp. CCY1209]
MRPLYSPEGVKALPGGYFGHFSPISFPNESHCGCYIIASNYPVIEHQVHWPTSIGSTFDRFDEIPERLDRAIVHIRETGQDNHWQWRQQRNAEAIAKILFPGECEPSDQVPTPEAV